MRNRITHPKHQVDDLSSRIPSNTWRIHEPDVRESPTRSGSAENISRVMLAQSTRE